MSFCLVSSKRYHIGAQNLYSRCLNSYIDWYLTPGNILIGNLLPQLSWLIANGIDIFPKTENKIFLKYGALKAYH